MPVSARPRHAYQPPRKDPIEEVFTFHQELVNLHNAGISVAKLALDFVRSGGQCNTASLLELLRGLDYHVQQFKVEIDKLAIELKQTNDHIYGVDRTIKALELGMRYQNLIGLWTEQTLGVISSIQTIISVPQQGAVHV